MDIEGLLKHFVSVSNIKFGLFDNKTVALDLYYVQWSFFALLHECANFKKTLSYI